jgi:effector-binding domain-containing protein
MEIKVLPVTLAYTKKVETSLKDIGQHVGTAPMSLAAQASKEGYIINGPQFWNYTGMDGNPDTKFQLEICFPVDEKFAKHSENVIQIPGFRCAALTVKGPWSELGKAYEKLVAEMAAENLRPGINCREQYLVVDFEHPENNVTEIQLGID